MEVFPVVRVLGIETDFVGKGGDYIVYFHEIPKIDIYDTRIIRLGKVDMNRKSSVRGCAIPVEDIWLIAPEVTLLFKFNSSFYYVSSGGAFRPPLNFNYTIFGTPVLPHGGGILNMVYESEWENYFRAAGLETLRAHPLWGIQNGTRVWTYSEDWVTAFSFDLLENKLSDVLYYIGLWSSPAGGYAQARPEISEDGVTWVVPPAPHSETADVERFGGGVIGNLKFRYIRFRYRTTTSARSCNLVLRKLIIFR